MEATRAFKIASSAKCTVSYIMTKTYKASPVGVNPILDV